MLTLSVKRAAALLCMAVSLTCNGAFAQGPTDFTAVAKKAIPAVVSIRVKMESRAPADLWGEELFEDPSDQLGNQLFRHFFGLPQRERTPPSPTSGFGSGFLVSDEGLILTNAHVVREAKEIQVILNDGREFEAKLIGTDPTTDVAIVKIDANGLPYLKMGDSDELEVGQWVIAVGNPLGLRASLTAGVVSAKDRSNLDIARIEDFIQTDAAINQGNSGGPLLDMEGNVMGVNTALATTVRNGGYMGIGFAIPSNIAENVMEELISTGSVSRGFLGVTLQDIDSGLAQAFDLKRVEGALITDVAAGSPAEKADLRQGDIILSFAGKPVRNMRRLANRVMLMKPGTEATIVILRNGKKVTMKVAIGSSPDREAALAASRNSLGIEVESLTPDLARKLGTEEKEGVVVTKINPNGIAAWAGIRKGMLILSVNQRKISSVEEYARAISEADPDKPLLLLVKQGEATRFISIKIQ